MRRRPFYIDEDTTDAFMDAPAIRYKGGSLFDRLEQAGFDTANMAGVATEFADRRRAAGLPELPPLPPPVDH
jgi:hypothetical protein